MLPSPFLARLPRGLACLVALGLLAASGPARGEAQAPRPDEVRALWVVRSTLATPEGIDRMVAAARRHGFNALLVQVRGRGDAYYRSEVEPRAAALAPQAPEFDPLARTIDAARAAGLQVHAWVTVNLVSSAADLPVSRRHVIHRHPEWLMVPRPLAAQMAGLDPRSPAYVGTLARWTRQRSNEVEGLYLSPVHPGAAAYTTRVMVDLVSRYRLDGLHLDYIRYPSATFDYSRQALDDFRAEMLRTLPAPERDRLERQARLDPFAYPDAHPDRWRAFRQARVTALVQRIRTAVKAVRPDLVLSAAVVPDLADAQTHRLQDWRTWLELGLLDVVCPMAYTQDPAVFARQVAAVGEFAGLRPVWAGIGAYRLPAAGTVSKIQLARRAGTRGIVLFSYDSLADGAQGDDYLAAVARGAFGEARQADGAR